MFKVCLFLFFGCLLFVCFGVFYRYVYVVVVGFFLDFCFWGVLLIFHLIFCFVLFFLFVCFCCYFGVFFSWGFFLEGDGVVFCVFCVVLLVVFVFCFCFCLFGGWVFVFFWGWGFSALFRLVKTPESSDRCKYNCLFMATLAYTVSGRVEACGS